MAEHTPWAFKPFEGEGLPGHFDSTRLCGNFIDSEGLRIALIGSATAEFIVRAVNSHQELLDALKDLREAATDAYKVGRIAAEPFVKAGNVIAKAEAK